ncbi:sensor histidine kinase [Halomicroarcula sp. GCM10025709]|uniref:sensor histidine kinase n=1 Tax=Halomicroarcula sp. GCM10025709 TaxID=3252669 RepID=UPI0036177790
MDMLTTDDEEHVEAAQRAVGRMQRLIDDLLSLAREGETVSEVEAVEIATVAELAWGSIDAPEVTLDIESDAVVEADPSRLQQLFENLFRNAIEHGSTGGRPETDDAPEHGAADGTITVGTLDRGFYVVDDGPGIPEDQRDRVFEQGYSTQANGTGFGLNIVADIVAAHDWSVSVTDGEEGGARFEVTGVDTY